MKFILSKTRKEEKFGIVLGCRYFIKKVHYPANSDAFANLHEGDEVIKVRPIDQRRELVMESRSRSMKRPSIV